MKKWKNRRNAFTLIELLAVIIILGILMIIAVPSVTRYINDSRKSAYIDTAKQVASEARNLVNSGKLEMYDTSVAYYIPNTCIKIENGDKAKSPYGEFIDDRTYVIVTYDGKGYDYYWISLDDTGTGIKEPINIDKLEEKDIETDLTRDDVKDNNGVGKEKVVIFNSTCDGKNEKDAIKVPICKRATELHKGTCNSREDYGCRAEGQYAIGGTIEYGNLGVLGEQPHAGDAYDCDVNADGVYDSGTERFYYITSDGENSVLIYYTNLNNNSTYAYDTRHENWHGPVDLVDQLPTTEEWKNIKIIPPGSERIILNENGVATTNRDAKTIDNPFSGYRGKAARLITYQEVNKACGYAESATHYSGYLSRCNYLMENIGIYENETGFHGYWTETPRDRDYYTVWEVTGFYRRLYSGSIENSSNCGVRPVITVKTSNIEK